jgi:hypothetical protein
MKRCPLCDFIYEDEQSLCDMDGFELVADSGLLTRLDKTTTVPAELAQPTSSWGRRLAFPTVATVVLGAVLFLVYYVPTHRAVRQSNYSPTQVTTGSQPGQTLDPAPPAQGSPAVEAMTTASPTDSPQSSPSPESVKPKAQAEGNTSRSKNLVPSPSPPPAPKRSEKKSRTATAQPVGANQKNEFKLRDKTDAKKDSRIASFLKKTGRILKKPFEF